MKQRRVIGRIVTRASIFVLLGAIATFAVAWAGSCRAFGLGQDGVWLSKQRRSTCARAQVLWQRHAADGWPEPPLHHQAWQGLFASGWSMGYSASGSYLILGGAPDAGAREIYRGSGSFRVEQIDCGFPFAAMRIERWQSRAKPRNFAASVGHDGVIFFGQSFPTTILPLRFGVNTILYGAALWLIAAAPALLHRLRRERGLCPACGYPIGTSPVCTECGRPVKQGKHAAERGVS